MFGRRRQSGDGASLRWERRWQSSDGARLRWDTARGVAGATHFSDDGCWTIHSVGRDRHLLYKGHEFVGDFTTVALAVAAANTAENRDGERGKDP
jgi:hypothetical protein